MQRLGGDDHPYSEVDVEVDHPRRDIHFLGVHLTPMSLPELNGVVESAIREKRKWIIANHNLHSLYLFHTEAFFRRFYERAAWTAIDGMSLVALGRLYGHPVRREQRVTYVDWTPSLIELAASKGWRVFYLGGNRGVAEQGAAVFRRQHPNLVMEARDGFFDATAGGSENEHVLQQIRAFAPDLLFVGMGMPRQEIWIADNFERLTANAILPCGAAIDYVAEAVPTPPRWAGRVGMEWLFRLISEPRRLFRRYLIEPWYVFFLVTQDGLRWLRRNLF